MRCFLAILLTLSLAGFAAGDEAAQLKSIAKGMREGEQEALGGLKELHSEKAAAWVLEAVSSHRVGGGMKARLAEIVAGWPATAAGRRTLLDWLAKHPACGEDELLFFAEIHLKETRSFFWSLIEQAKGEPGRLKAPYRLAMAVKALGFFEDTPELVVSRIGSFLSEEHAHVVRACSADALGGMRQRKAAEVLLPHVEDEAIGPQVVRSLYRLTGKHFEHEPSKQWLAWLAENAQIDFKMHAPADFDEFLKVQALVKPVDDSLIDMESFYGVKVEGNGLLFILDVSGSMTIGERISKLRGQMGNILTVLEGRPERLRYGILTFADWAESCFPKGIAVNDVASRKKATKYIESLEADGGTAMVAALNHAKDKVLPDANLDTIYLLSDGEPSDGNAEMVLNVARRIHQLHQCRIHTIAIGEDQPTVFGEKSLLEEVAALTGGTFTRVRDGER